MSYRSESIAVAIGRMNRQYFLPAIQREFVWKPEQIVQLFDSIMRGYPISSFLFWDLNPENRDKWQVYEFLENAQHGGSHNQLASTDGVMSLSLVLDGQQRLTSLMIGLRGTYKAKKKYKRWDNPDAWSAQKLHLDLFADPRLDNEGESESGVYYKFGFMEETPAPTSEHYWFRAGRILDFDERQKFEAFLDERDDELSKQGLSRSERRTFQKNLDRLYQAVHEDEVIAYYTETDQDYDRVLDIFVRANEGGTKLSKSDLLLSMVTASWDGVDARDEIFSFVDRVNTQLTRRNDFDKDFIMKSCLVLTDLPVAYKVQNFNNENLTTIRQHWPRIKKAVEAGTDLANSFGIDRDNLTSANALIPVIYYLFKNPGVTLRGSTPFEARNADRVRRWLIMALLNGVFGGTSDNMLRDVRASLQGMSGPGADFPIDAINTTIRKAGRSAEFNDFALDEVLARAYGQQQTFLALSLLYEDAGWGTMQFHQDHIFARSLFKPRELSTSGRQDWINKKDRLGNLCLLLAAENIGKQDMPVDEWLGSREPGFLKRHLIPADQALWKFERFPDFLEAREELVRRRLKALFGPTAAQHEHVSTARISGTRNILPLESPQTVTRAAPPKQPRAELIAAVNAYDLTAEGDMCVRLGTAPTYRQIYPPKWKTSCLHYEFYQARGRIGAELHLASGLAPSKVVSIGGFLKRFVGRAVANGEGTLEWRLDIHGGRGCLAARFPLTSSPQTVAAAMRDLISMTRSGVSERL